MNDQRLNWESPLYDEEYSCASCLLFQSGPGPIGICLLKNKGRYDRSKSCKGIVLTVTQGPESTHA
jgi:hypothetical protein